MRKFIIILAITVLAVGGIYFLIEQGTFRSRSSRIAELIGSDLDSEYLEKTTVVTLGIRRFLAIENRKIDFWLKRPDVLSTIEDFSSSQVDSHFYDYTASNQNCDRIRVISDDLEIVHSSSDRDLVGSTLDRELYGRIEDKNRAQRKSVIIDPLVESIVFYRPLGDINFSSSSGRHGGQAEFARYYVLFYYTWDVLDSVFGRIGSFAYEGFRIIDNTVILINFPEVETSEEEKLAHLSDLISVKESGAARLLLGDHEKTIYYRKLGAQFPEWVLGIATDTRNKRISKTGIFIIVLQSLVVASVLIVLVLSVIVRKETTGNDDDTYPPKQARKRGRRTRNTGFQNARVSNSGESEDEQGTERGSIGTGVVLLDEIEEVTELDELGEAEIAERIEEEEDVSGIDPETSAGDEASENHEEEQSELEREKLHTESGNEYQMEEVYVSARSRDESVGENSVGEPILDDAPQWNPEAKTERFSKSLPDLEKLVKAQPELYDTENVSPVLKTTEGKSMHESDSSKKEESLPTEHNEPNSEPSVRQEGEGAKNSPAMNDQSSNQENRGEEGPLTVPEEVFREKKEIKHNDELAQLIDELDENGQEDSPSTKEESLNKLLKQFIERHGLSRGAILLRESGARLSPSTTIGFDEETRSRLNFDGSEKIVKNILLKDKILYIREDAFMNSEVREKFGIVDSSKIKNLFFVPLIKDNSLNAVVIVCSTMGEQVDPNVIIESIKDLRQDIVTLV